MTQPVLHLSSVVGRSLVDRAGEELGRVEDLIVRLADGGFPPVTGLRARIGGRELFVPADRVASLGADGVQLSGEKLNLARFQRRVGEVLLREDVLGRKLVDVESARLVTAHEIELLCVDGWWRVVGVDPTFRARFRRLLPRRPRSLLADGPFLDWTQIEPFVGHVPSARLRFSHRKLARLHPAQIADLVEAASHEEGEEIIAAVGQDRELEADVFEELDDDHQLEFIRERSDAAVAAVLGRMAPDDAADLIGELEQERREPVLSLLPAVQQRRIRKLLGYNPSTAGGLMSPEFVLVADRAPVSAALKAIRESGVPAHTLTAIFIHAADGVLAGMVSLASLLRATDQTPLAELAEGEPVCVEADADLPEVARTMTDYNLTMLAVVEGGQLIGVITVDDILEEMLPADWRRRFGVARG